MIYNNHNSYLQLKVITKICKTICFFFCCCRCLADLPTLHGLSSSGLSRCSSVSSDEERNDLNCRGKIQTKVINTRAHVYGCLRLVTSYVMMVAGRIVERLGVENS